MTNRRISFLKLVLEGFMSYRQRTQFCFNEGINIFVAENEKGKTTMLLGIVSVIFGIVSSQNKEEIFSRENLRNRYRPGAFFGELTFLCDSQKYRIERDFETNRIEVFKMAESGDFSRILLGEHNPNARRSFYEYENMIEEIFSIGSREVFFETFFVMQPLPEMSRIGNELQSILAGGGKESFSQSTNVLIDEIKKISKYTGPNGLGITARNMSKDGVLEELKNRLNTVESDMHTGRQIADALIQAMENEETIRKSLDEVRKNKRRIDSLLRSLSEWKRLRSEYKNAGRQSREYTEKLQQESNLYNIYERSRVILNEKYPKYWNSNEDVFEKIRKHRELKSGLNEALSKKSILEKDLGIQKENIGSISGKGDSPVINSKIYKEACKRFTDDLSRFIELLEEIKEIDSKISNKYYLLNNLDEYEKNIFKTWPYEKNHIIEKLEKVKEKYELLKQNRDEYDRRKNDIEQRYSFIAGFDTQAEEELKDRYLLLKTKNEITEKINKDKERLRSVRSYIIPVLLVMISIYGVFATGNLPYIIPGSIAGALWMAYIFFGNRKIYRDKIGPGEKILSEINDKLSGIRDFKDMDPETLIKDLEKYRLEIGYFSEAFQKPSDEELRMTENEYKTALRSKDIFDSRFRAYETAFPDPGIAYENYTQLMRERDILCKQAYSYHQRPFDLLDLEAAVILDKPGAIESLEFCREFLKDEGKPEIVTVKDLYTAAKKHDTNKYNMLFQEIEDKINRVNAVNTEIDRITMLLTDISKNISELEEEIALNGKDITDFITDDPEQMLTDLNKYLEELKKYEKAKLEHEAFLMGNQIEDRTRLKEQADQYDRLASVRFLEWSRYIDINPGLPGIEVSEDSEKLIIELEKLKNGFDEYETEEHELEKKYSIVTSELGKLQGMNPVNIARAEIERNELIEKTGKWEFELKVCITAFRELSETIVEYRESYREILEVKSTSYLRKMTGREDRKIFFDDDFSLVVTEHGRRINISGLSRGARDQVYISIRLGLADLLSNNRSIPVIFDDSFAGTDQHRLENIYEIIRDEAEQRQIFLLSHSEGYCGWGERIHITK